MGTARAPVDGSGSYPECNARVLKPRLRSIFSLAIASYSISPSRYHECVHLPGILSLFISIPLFAQQDGIVKFSRQIPKAEFLHVISDGRGDVFALGRTRDATFVVPRDAAQPRLTGGYDLVVAKFRGSDGEMLAATFLGGSLDENPTGIALDPQGFVYVTGVTASRNFPVTEGAVQRTPQGTSSQGFVAKFAGNLRGAAFSTYLGGNGPTRIAAITADRVGNAYVTGTTDAANFPVTPGAFRSVGGPGTAFATKLSATGTSVVSSTFLGAAAPVGIAVDLDGNMIIIGTVNAENYPVTPDAAQSTLSGRGTTDLFLTRVNPLGAMQYSTFLGGSSNDQAAGMVQDASGSIYIGGVSYSPRFPGTSELLGEVGVAFVVKFTGLSVAWTRPLRANGLSTVSSLEAASEGGVHLTGITNSTHFETTAGAHRRCVSPDLPGGAAPYYARLGADGSLKYSSYVYENVGGLQWAATLPAGDLVTMGRVATQFEQAPNLLRRYALAETPSIRLDCAVNAASYRTAGITPGMAITLFGSGMGPVEGVVASLDGDGKVPATVAGVRVLVNGVPAPLLFVRQDQINAIVPFAVASSAQVRVEYEGRAINTLALPVKIAEPGIFRLGASGFGAILNQDNTLNTPENPAARGSIITFWAVGMGPFTGSYSDGSIVGSELFPLQMPVRVTLSGAEGQVLYAGASPSMVAGITQLNVRIPANARVSSRVAIAITAGEVTIADLAYVSVR